MYCDLPTTRCDQMTPFIYRCLVCFFKKAPSFQFSYFQSLSPIIYYLLLKCHHLRRWTLCFEPIDRPLTNGKYAINPSAPPTAAPKMSCSMMSMEVKEASEGSDIPFICNVSRPTLRPCLFGAIPTDKRRDSHRFDHGLTGAQGV